MLILALGICCSTILLLLRWSAGITVLQVQGRFCAMLLHVFLSVLRRDSRERLLCTVLTYLLWLRQQVVVSALRDEMHVLRAKQAPLSLTMDSLRI